jgi:hypothetical protein
VSSDVVRTHIFTGILIFKGLTARRLYKSFGVKGLKKERPLCINYVWFPAYSSILIRGEAAVVRLLCLHF